MAGYVLRCLRTIAVVVISTASIPSAFAIVLSDADTSHVVTRGSVSYSLNLEGVFLLGTDAPNSVTVNDILIKRCTGALISDRHLLTAAHCVDEDEDGVVDSLVSSFPFVAGFELPEDDVLAPINTEMIHLPQGWPDEQHDIAVLELVEPAPTEIPRYPLYGRTDEIGKRSVVTGYGATGLGSAGIDLVASESFIKRAGLNRLDDFFDERQLHLGYDFDSGQDANNTFALFDIASDLGFGDNEVTSADGDSGAPLFVGDAIAGVYAFNAWLEAADVNDTFDSSWGEVSFNTRVSSFQDFITTATGGEAVFVPEPKTPLPIVAISVLAWAMRRKAITSSGI